jgi:hypothetical protein
MSYSQIGRYTFANPRRAYEVVNAAACQSVLVEAVGDTAFGALFGARRLLLAAGQAVVWCVASRIRLSSCSDSGTESDHRGFRL